MHVVQTACLSNCLKRTAHDRTLLADKAEVAVPENRKAVDEEYAIVEWDEREVENLDKWPDHPVTGKSALVGSSKLLAWAGTLKD